MTGRLLAMALALLAVPALADPIAALDERAAMAAIEREAISRILEADNVDVASLTTREVASRIAAIPRDEAPDDFWSAYQAHVRAWRRAADAEEKLAGLVDGKRGDFDQAVSEAGEALAAVEATFDEVERIAAQYGVAMPVPPGLAEPPMARSD